MNPIQPFLASFNKLNSDPNPENLQNFDQAAISLSTAMRDQGTKLARSIADDEGGSKSNASQWFNNLEKLLNLDFSKPLIPDSKSKATLIQLQKAAAKSIKDFTNFFRTDEAILKDKVGFPTKEAKAIFSIAA